MAEKWIELAKREVSMGKKLAILLIPAVALTVTLAGGFASAAVQAAVSQKGNENRKTVWDGVFTAAESTPSQTAWAILGLLAGGDTTSQSVHKGIEYLLRTQRPDGSWNEELATGTGFPKVFYLNYHLYRLYFPLLALSEYRTVQQNGSAD